MEAIGGSGYVEENALARIYREMPVNSIWEGSGNIMCLDVLRALRKSARGRGCRGRGARCGPRRASGV
jgi:putative acyl-CoA dehydrogenase